MSGERVVQVRVELRTEHGQDPPHEAMTWNLPDDLSMKDGVIDGEPASAREQIAAFIDHHVDGECACLDGGRFEMETVQKHYDDSVNDREGT